MTDLVSDTPPVTQSPKRKFSFRFPNLSHHGSGSGGGSSSVDKDSPSGSTHHHSSGSGNAGAGSHQMHSGSNGSTSGAGGSLHGSVSQHSHHKTRNFSEEIKNVSDLQVSFYFLKMYLLYF